MGAQRAGKFGLDSHDEFLLEEASQLVEDVLTGLRAAHDLSSPGPYGVMLCNCVVQTVLNKDMGTDKQLKTVQDLKAYFQSIALVLRNMGRPSAREITGQQLALAQRFFLEFANTLPFEQSDDETRVTIAMEETLLRELKRAAQHEGIPVPQLVAEIILDHLKGSQASATAG